jgi:hypothetical protein
MTVDEALRIQGEVRGLQHDDVRQAALDVLADEVRRMTLLLVDERSDFTALAEHHVATELEGVDVKAENEKLQTLVRNADVIHVCDTDGYNDQWNACPGCEWQKDADAALAGGK